MKYILQTREQYYRIEFSIGQTKRTLLLFFFIRFPVHTNKLSELKLNICYFMANIWFIYSFFFSFSFIVARFLYAFNFAWIFTYWFTTIHNICFILNVYEIALFIRFFFLFSSVYWINIKCITLFTMISALSTTTTQKCMICLTFNNSVYGKSKNENNFQDGYDDNNERRIRVTASHVKINSSKCIWFTCTESQLKKKKKLSRNCITNKKTWCIGKFPSNV